MKLLNCKPLPPGFTLQSDCPRQRLLKNKKLKLRLKFCETGSKTSTPVSRRDSNFLGGVKSPTLIKYMKKISLLRFAMWGIHLVSFKPRSFSNGFGIALCKETVNLERLSFRIRVCSFRVFELVFRYSMIWPISRVLFTWI